MRLNWFTFFAQVLNFLVLVALLRRFLFEPVLSAVRERDSRISQRERLANERENAAIAKERDLESRLCGLENERLEVLRTANAGAELQEARILREARREASHLKLAAQEAARAEERATRSELLVLVGNCAINIANELLREWSGSDLNERMVKKFCAELREWQCENAQAANVRNFAIGEQVAVVRSSHELADAHRSCIALCIRNVFPWEGEIRFEVDASLGLGISALLGEREFAVASKNVFSQLNGNLDDFWSSKQILTASGENHENGESGPGQPESRL